MVSMLTYFYMDAGIVDRWNFPIPVDFHALRTMFAHEIVIADQSEWNGNAPCGGRRRPAGELPKLSPKRASATLCEAVWLYSGLMCNQHPGNQSIEIGLHEGRKTELRPMPRWSLAQTRTYERTCAACFIQNTCRQCVPSAEYYVGGRIILRKERDAPPQQSLFPLLL